MTPLIEKAVRYAGKTGLETLIGLLSDLLSGENVKTAANVEHQRPFNKPSKMPWRR